MKKPFYITTPIYYPSDKLHIGHAYCTVGTDAMARYKRLRGYDVHFLTGTDEHGQKIERVAQNKNITPKEYVDEIVASIKDLWQLMDISYDDFIRTTDEKHQKCVQKIFKKLYDQGDIYKSEYEGWYCTPCETFFTEHQLQNGNCPDCNRPVEKVREESYFFRLSKYQDRIIQYIEDNPDFIQPESRKNEMLNNFLKPGLEDLAVSRTSFTWGIPVEFDPGHIVYVWVDALSNYISALGYLTDNDAQFQKYWPADVQHVGKEIIRFHTIIWPALLMALDLPLPKKVFGHGWLVIDGGKMSKSKGNVVDPKILSERYGVDAIRYFLLRDFAWGQDGNFTNEGLIQRINSDLANDLGNLLSRTVSMIEKYFSSKLSSGHKQTEYDEDLVQTAQKAIAGMEEKMEVLAFNEALAEIWTLIRRTNKYIDETAPWVLAKDDANQEILANAMYHLAESLRITSILILPFMPNTANIIKEQLQIPDGLFNWDSLQWGKLPKDTTVKKGAVAFPRIDVKKELESLEKAIKESQSQTAAAGSEPKKEEITIEDFDKVELKIGKVLECEKVKGSDKLLKSQVKIGGEVRQIVSGIAKYYTPEDMIGKKVIVVTNLKPVKLRGEMSNGMILCSEDKDGNLFLATTDNNCMEGAVVR